MSIIPARVKKTVEKRLRHNDSMKLSAIQRREQAEDSIDNLVGKPIAPGMPRAKGGIADPTARTATAIVQAQHDVDVCKKWAYVIAATYAMFSQTRIPKMASAYYGNSVTMKQVAGDMGVDVQTVSEWREKFVCTCALLAAERGLIRIDEDMEGGVCCTSF